MIKHTTIKLSKEILQKLNAHDIIYAEVSEDGAMGNDGGIMVYVIQEEQLICYETNLYENKDTYLEARAFVLIYQNELKHDGIKVTEQIFDYYYGGMGNHVFVNKSVSLKSEDGFFLYKVGTKAYQVSCSVQGVYNAIAYSMENSKNNLN